MNRIIPKAYMNHILEAVCSLDIPYGLNPPEEIFREELERFAAGVPLVLNQRNIGPLAILFYYRWGQFHHPGVLGLRSVFYRAGVKMRGFANMLARIRAAGYIWGDDFRTADDQARVDILNKLSLLDAPDSPLVQTAITLLEKYGGEMGTTPGVQAATSYSVAQLLLHDPAPRMAYRIAKIAGCSTSSVYGKIRSFCNRHPGLFIRAIGFSEESKTAEQFPSEV